MRRSCYWLAQARALRRQVSGDNVFENVIVHRDIPYQEGSSSSTERRGALAGWSVSVKDNFCTEGMPTSCSSLMLQDYQSPFEATAVKLLKKAGGVVIGKTNCDEFGMGSANMYSIYGPVINPHSIKGKERVAGGSSGGAAVAVACNKSRIALASDTGGSIRIPAAYCGVYGLKPSYGLISRWGLVSYADSLDTVGLIASNSDDIKAAFQVISKHDHQDPTSIPQKYRDKSKELVKEKWDTLIGNALPLSGLRVGVPVEFFPAELNKDMLPALRATLERLKSLGAEIVSVSLPSTRFALSAYYVLASAEASSNLAKFDGIRYGHRAKASPVKAKQGKGTSAFHDHISKTRSEGFGREVQKRILLGTYSLTSELFNNYFLQAQKVRTLIRRDFDQVFRMPNILSSSLTGQSDGQGVDVLVSPSTVNIAPTLEEAAKMGIQAYTQDILTVPASLAGLPAMSIPAGEANEMPVGVTLTAQWGFDELLFDLASHLSET